jgi:hypothetical protein
MLMTMSLGFSTNLILEPHHRLYRAETESDSFADRWFPFVDSKKGTTADRRWTAHNVNCGTKSLHSIKGLLNFFSTDVKLPQFLIAMNSEVTLTNYSTSLTLNGQVRLLYKRSDPRNAILLENGVPRYFLATSEDGVRKVKISDTAQNAIAEVERRSIAKDVFKFANRFDGKAVKVTNVLRKEASTSDGCVIIIFLFLS